MEVLQNLSEQLDPLETAYADVRFFDVDVEQTQQEFNSCMSDVNNELNNENALCGQEQQLIDDMANLEKQLLSGASKQEVDDVSFPPFRLSIF